MINRYFHGILGKLAGVGYSLGIVALLASLALATWTPGHAQGSGAIWTTHDGCGTPDQDVNHYDTGESVWINGSGFSEGSHSWSITGKPGGASGDPGQDVASGTVNVDASGKFCFNAYTVAADDWGEYQVKVGNKGDNYRVEQQPTATPVPPTNTPTDTPAGATNTPTHTSTHTPTDTPTHTPTSQPSNTATNTPTHTPTDTLTPTATNTLAPGETPSITPTPSDTPAPTATFTNTPEPPNLIDPKGDSLLTDNDGNGVPSPGDVLLYTVTITNTGATAAGSVTFSDSPDPNTSLVVGSVTTTQGTVTSGNTGGDTTIGVDIGTIEPDATVTITFEVTIDAGLPSSVQEVANQGVVSGDNFDDSPTDDPDTEEPDDPTVTQIVHPTATPAPGGPTPTEAPAEGTPSTVLIPVTGAERTVVHTNTNLPGILYNLGLSLLGISLILHGLSFGRRKDN